MRFLPLLLVATALTACGGSGAGQADVQSGAWGGVLNPDGEPARGGTLRVDQFAAPEGLSPLFFLANPDKQIGQVVTQVFDRLVEFAPGSIDPQPGLAERWTVSDDGLTYTFELREAEFSNGMPVTSADAMFTLEKLRSSLFFAVFGQIAEVRAPDASTVVVRLSKPAPALLDFLTFPGASIVPAKVVRSMGEDAFNKRPVGSGPFVVERWKRGQEVRLVRNDRYWRRGLPYLDEVTLAAIPDGNTRILNVQSGTTDVADYVPFSQIESIDGGDAAKVLVAPGGDMNVVWINNAKEPFGELAVRQALNYATPVESIVDVVFAGRAPRMNTVISKTKYWTRDTKPYPYDVEKAKRLLAESSAADGFSATLAINGNDRPSKQTAEILQQAWSKIGVDVTIEQLDDGAQGATFVDGKYELMLFRPGEFSTDAPVDDQFAQLLFDSPETHNLYTWYENPITARLARRAVAETDEDERARLFEQLHVASMKDPSVVPLVYTPNRAAVRNDVQGFNYLISGMWRLDTVWKRGS